MATVTRNILINGAALGTAAAIMVAAPAVIPGQIAGLPTPAKLSSAQYELSALSIQGITDALTNGYGGVLGASDPFYPGVFNNDTKATGVLGAAYYVIDNSIGAFIPFNLDNYFFEVGAQSDNAILGGLGAAAYVGVGSIFGANSIPAQLVNTLVGGGSVDLGAAIMQLTSGIPVIGNLASVYFTGQAIGDTTDYGTGFAGLLNYANTLLPGLAQLGGLTGVISAVTGFIGSIFGGRGGAGHHDDSEDDHHGGSYSDDESDDEHDHHHNYSAASVLSAARTAVSAPKAAATASVPSVASDNTPSAEVEAPEASETATDVTAPKVDATDVAGSNNAGEATEAAPKRPATRAASSKGADKAAAAREGKRAKVSRAS